MKNYKAYFALTVIFVLFLFFLLGKAITTGEWGYLNFILFGYAYLGLLQLMTGVYLLSKFKRYPEWIRTGIRNYWLFTGAYIALWIGNLFWVLIPDQFVWVWLLIVPLFIAGYQFQLIWQMAGLRRRQLEQRAFVQIYSH